MSKIPYIDYNDLDEFYTIPQLCKLFSMSKAELKAKCEQYDVELRRNEIGEYGLVKYDVRRLHNYIYKEDRKGKQMDDDPWA